MDGHVCCEVRVTGCVDVENRAFPHVEPLFKGKLPVLCSLARLYLEHYIFIRPRTTARIIIASIYLVLKAENRAGNCYRYVQH